MLDLLTFTGVDEFTALDKLAALAERYPKVEFAVLVAGWAGSRRSHTRYPSLERIFTFRDWGRDRRMNTAVHLCGRWARGALEQGASAVPRATAAALCAGFGRVQLNLPDGFLVNDADKRAALDRFAEEVGCANVIVQRRRAHERAPATHPKVEYLFDLSAGTGRESFDEWPAPRAHEHKCGYAGGIGPASIERALEFVDRHHARPVWLDMESNVRTNDRLDVDAVEQVCAATFDK